MQDSAAAQQRINALQVELNEANTKIVAQGTVVQDVMGLGSDLKNAQHRMEAQTAGMQKMDTVTDEMVEQVGKLTEEFIQIDDERQRAQFVNVNPIKSASVHVQGAQSHVTEQAGNVQTVPTANVINLMSQGTSGSDVAEQKDDGHNWLEGRK